MAVEQSLASSVVFIGATATGKEVLADTVAVRLQKHSINTGRAPRLAADRALEAGYIEPVGDVGARFTSGGAVERIAQWLTSGSRGIHFDICSPNIPSADIFFGAENMTPRIHPKYRRRLGLVNLEPAAALVATESRLRPHFNALWRDALLAVGGGPIIAKRPDQFIPEVKHVVALSADDILSAGYRLWRGVAVCDSFADELVYIRRRNALHTDNGLDMVPEGALHIDMSVYNLFYALGMQKAADKVLAYMDAN